MNRVTSAALFPFWLIGRTFAAIGVATLWVWKAFLDGLGPGEDDFNLDALFLIWLICLTVWIAL